MTAPAVVGVWRTDAPAGGAAGCIDAEAPFPAGIGCAGEAGLVADGVSLLPEFAFL